MKLIQMVMDRSGVIDNEFTPPEVITQALKDHKDNYIPLTVGHDIRNPPIGRVWPTTVVVSDDGTHLLKAEGEIFEEIDNLSSVQAGQRTVRIQAEEVQTFQAFGNQTFEEDEDVADLYRDLRNLGSGSEDQAYRENSVDPISLLIIGCGVFIVQGISNGFFSKLGEDLYEVLKRKLQKIYERKQLEDKEQLLQFQLFVISEAGRPIEINIVLTNPSQKDIDEFFNCGLVILDSVLPRIPLDDLDLCRIVFSYQSTGLRILYGLRSDSIPITFYYK